MRTTATFDLGWISVPAEGINALGLGWWSVSLGYHLLKSGSEIDPWFGIFLVLFVIQVALIWSSRGPDLRWVGKVKAKVMLAVTHLLRKRVYPVLNAMPPKTAYYGLRGLSKVEAFIYGFKPLMRRVLSFVSLFLWLGLGATLTLTPASWVVYVPLAMACIVMFVLAHRV